jgi:hypothetical protein
MVRLLEYVIRGRSVNCPDGVDAVDWGDIAFCECVRENMDAGPRMADDRAVSYLLLLAG